jgi:hypothetical protein
VKEVVLVSISEFERAELEKHEKTLRITGL